MLRDFMGASFLLVSAAFAWAAAYGPDGRAGNILMAIVYVLVGAFLLLWRRP
jgi:hypothetical protein